MSENTTEIFPEDLKKEFEAAIVVMDRILGSLSHTYPGIDDAAESLIDAVSGMVSDKALAVWPDTAEIDNRASFMIGYLTISGALAFMSKMLIASQELQEKQDLEDASSAAEPERWPDFHGVSDIDPLDVKADTAVLVCIPHKDKEPMAIHDNITGQCFLCGRKIQFRPSVAHIAKKACLYCFAKSGKDKEAN